MQRSISAMHSASHSEYRNCWFDWRCTPAGWCAISLTGLRQYTHNPIVGRPGGCASIGARYKSYSKFVPTSSVCNQPLPWLLFLRESRKMNTSNSCTDPFWNSALNILLCYLSHSWGHRLHTHITVVKWCKRTQRQHNSRLRRKYTSKNKHTPGFCHTLRNTVYKQFYNTL
jgi:hypothetical protein